MKINGPSVLLWAAILGLRTTGRLPQEADDPTRQRPVIRRLFLTEFLAFSGSTLIVSHRFLTVARDRRYSQFATGRLDSGLNGRKAVHRGRGTSILK